MTKLCIKYDKKHAKINNLGGTEQKIQFAMRFQDFGFLDFGFPEFGELQTLFWQAIDNILVAIFTVLVTTCVLLVVIGLRVLSKTSPTS